MKPLPGQLLLLLGLLLLCIATPAARAQKLLADVPEQAQGLDIEEKVGNTLPLDEVFTNADGKQVRLGDYFKDGKPAVLALVYYKCPVICTVMMEKIAESLQDLDLTVGQDFNCLLVSFNPAETTQDASGRREAYLAGYNRPVTADVRAGWQFHTSQAAAVKELADAVGFKYKRLENGEYSHPACIFVITPEGKVSRYIYGFSYPARNLKLSLLDATEGKLVKSVGDRLLFFCYMYDDATGTYTLQVIRVMQIAGAATVIGLGGLIGLMILSERVRRRGANRSSTPALARANDASPRVEQPAANMG